MPNLTARSLKVTAVLDPAAVALVPTPNGQSKSPLTITAGGRVLKAEVNTKSLRRCIATITETGPDGCAVIIQGKLVGEVIEEAGIVAQAKAPKAAAAA